MSIFCFVSDPDTPLVFGPSLDLELPADRNDQSHPASLRRLRFVLG